jgi:polysaccharide export outer membrane protein
MTRMNVQKWISVTLVFLLLTSSITPLNADSVPTRREINKTGLLSATSDNPVSKDSGDSPKSLAEKVPGVLHSDQLIRPGDQLYISVSPAEELSRDITVDQNGKISIPLLGSVQAEGLTTDQLSQKITQAISKYVTHPKIDIFLKESSSKQIGLAGQVTAVGSFPYRSNFHLLDLISLAGGFLPSADRKKVRILRRSGTDRRVIIVNADEIMSSGDPGKDVLLQPGDMVEVSRGRGGIAIFGTVDSPGVYDYIYDMRMIDLISACHGFHDGANIKHIMVIRGEGVTQTTTIINFNQVVRNNPKANIALQPGDIVYVPQRSLWTTSATAQVFTPIATIVLTIATVILAVKK